MHRLNTVVVGLIAGTVVLFVAAYITDLLALAVLSVICGWVACIAMIMWVVLRAATVLRGKRPTKWRR